MKVSIAGGGSVVERRDSRHVWIRPRLVDDRGVPGGRIAVEVGRRRAAAGGQVRDRRVVGRAEVPKNSVRPEYADCATGPELLIVADPAFAVSPKVV